MERRSRKRFARRLQIQYWLKGDEHARQGYTTNVSTTGAFIATNAPLAPGSRLRVEFQGESSFFVEAVVTHAARVSTSLQSIRSSGMGIRFITIGELVSGFLPAGREHETEATEEIARKKIAYAESRLEPESGKPTVKHGGGRQTTYTVGFRNVAYLLDAIENEIAFGGVFVVTDSPAGLQQDVRIALALPAPIKRTVHAEATVVTVSDASSASDESTVTGMGVAFKDAPKVLDELNKLIERARPKPLD